MVEESVDITCTDGCEAHTLTVPIYCIGPDNTVHIDHAFLAAHHDQHRREDCDLAEG